MKKYFLTCLAIIFSLVIANAQKTISGIVNDSDGLPLPGASIVEKGTSNGVTSDFDGNYSIEASEGSILVFSFVGYTSQEITVGSDDTINVSLESGTELEEVVLTALGLEKKKDDDLTSTTKIEVDDVQRSGESGILQGMSGKTSGVNITRNSGDPGSGAYIQIRGQNTVFGDISPLIILDGAIISNDNIGGQTAGVVQQSRLNDINPDDIESISVIKGAAAAAIYGTGAANGVLVINTKRGSESPKGWSVNAKTSLSIETINAEWKKQGSWGQGFPG
ncbi:MAG: SusC/RagA family TonB-linked outer membrane protein, partial [Flavobacteriales bacterium]